MSWLLPAVCPGCQRDLPVSGPVCAECWAAIMPPASAPLPIGIDRYQAAAAFEPPLRDLILSFKYRGKDYLGRWLGTWMGKKLLPWAGECTLIVPVPSPAWRRVRRGYHPADVLADAVAKHLRRPVAPRLLRRRHGYPSQTTLDRRDRGENASKSFALGWRPARVEGKKVLLVDDVSTTGATLSVCAGLLRFAGARSVDAVVLAQEALKSGATSTKAAVVPLLDAVAG